MKALFTAIVLLLSLCVFAQEEKSWEEVNAIGEKAYEGGKYSKALKYFTLGLKLARKKFSKDHKKYAEACNNLAVVYQKKGRYNEAKTLHTKAKLIKEKTIGKLNNSYAISCDNLGVIFRIQGDLYQAKLQFLESKKIRKMIFGDKDPNYAESCSYLSLIYEKEGNLNKAIELCEIAKNIRENKLGDKHLDYAGSCNILAGLYVKLGLFRKAELLYLEARGVIRETLGINHPRYAFNCLNRATLYEKKEVYHKSETLFKEGLEIIRKSYGKANVIYATILNNIAALCSKQNYYDKAKNLLQEAKSIIKKKLGEQHPHYGIFCRNLGVVYIKLGNYEKALHLLNESIITLKEIHPSYESSCHNMAELKRLLGNYSEAKKFFVQSSKNLKNKIKRTSIYLSEFERNAFLEKNIIKGFECNNSFCVDYYNRLGLIKSKSILSHMYNNRLFTKSLLFNSTQKIKERIYKKADTALINLYERFIAKRVQYNKALEKSKSTRIKRGIDLEKLGEEANDLEKALSRKSAEFASVLEEYQPHTWQEVQQKLQPNEAAIEIIRFNWYNGQWTDTVYYAALIVTPNGKYPYPVFLKNGNLLEAKGYQDYYATNIGQKTKDQVSYQRFWQPIQTQLKKLYPQVNKVYLSLDGVYHLINLETLWNPKSGRYLGDELAIEIVSNTKDLLYREKTQNGLDTTSQVYLFGFPQYDQFNPQPNSKGVTRGSTQKPRELPKIFMGGQIKPLPGTRKEINNIQTLLAGKLTSMVYQGKTATEENIKALKNPGVLHLATHGYFLKSNHLEILKKTHHLQIAGTELRHYSENPLLRSGLVFTGAQASFKGKKQPDGVQENGILTAQEVVNLHLDSTQLVVLSACETGRGKIQNGEGVYGLQRAFLSAGAKNVLMSLWAVDDQATQYFMQYFYTALLQRQSIHQAYRTAQKRLRQDYPSPYYWGAFVLVRR